MRVRVFAGLCTKKLHPKHKNTSEIPTIYCVLVPSYTTPQTSITKTKTATLWMNLFFNFLKSLRKIPLKFISELEINISCTQIIKFYLYNFSIKTSPEKGRV